MRSVFIALLCFSPALGLNVEQDDAKNRPVSKVITLLKDMVSQLEKEAEEDEEVYEQMGCWCETNDREKTKSIADAEQRISDLTASIEDLTANSARLNTEIENLNKEVAKNEQALDQATALRKKQLAEFNEEEKDMLQSITSMKGAVVALSKHHEAALLQKSKTERETAVMEAAALIQHHLHTHADLLAEVITPRMRKTATAFIQSPDDYFSEEPSMIQQPQSGEIFGILKAMKESFETNLAQSQKEETENQSAYEDLKAAKTEEISAGQAQLDTKTNELANTDEKNAQSKQDLEDTRNSLAADSAFLANLKEQCQNVDQEYEERTKTRQLEIQAVSKALAFLSSDEAHDLFTRTFNFVQLSSESAQRSKAMKVLSAAAKKSGDPRLVALAVSARIAAFGKVKKTIQDMVDNLVTEKEDEIKHRDFCIEELNQNERDTESKNRDKADLEAEIDDLKMNIDELTRAIEQLKAEVAELQVQMKRAGEDREKQNKEFQVTVADQRATQKLLAAALNILKGFYEKAALVQKNTKAAQPAGPPPPPGFKSYEKNASSGGVMGMMQNIINDAKAMEAEAIRGEEDSQKAYEDFVKDTNDSVEEKSKDITNKSSARAKAEARKVEAETERDAVMGELEQLSSANADLHKSCDYTLKNFELRQSTRDDEIEALKQSIAIFSGASFGAFMQR
jgi:predicted RNase H-like nuclease (RuvC/YqgF family)